ncbi:MAG: hypothetical protein E7184_00770 [Erysipelotrichaceae bacterium]|nr:hypothetical protein [Erysipelotrichaceae bacterium]
MVLNGTKTIESRWSMNKIVPFEKIKNDEIIYLKETGKDVSTIAKVDRVEFYCLTESKVKELVDVYGEKIGIDDKEAFYQKNKNKKYGTLIWLKDVKNIESFKVKKSYGSGWLIIE